MSIKFGSIFCSSCFDNIIVSVHLALIHYILKKYSFIVLNTKQFSAKKYIFSKEKSRVKPCFSLCVCMCVFTSVGFCQRGIEIMIDKSVYDDLLTPFVWMNAVGTHQIGKAFTLQKLLSNVDKIAFIFQSNFHYRV